MRKTVGEDEKDGWIDGNCGDVLRNNEAGA
jgi:hypothetical protein